MAFTSYRYKRLVKMAKILISDGIRKDITINSGAIWYDDWFTVGEIGYRTFIISEPRLYLQNNSYLILGDSAALLFDTGSGKRDLSSVVFSREQLIAYVWGENYVGESTSIAVFVRKIREKIEDEPSKPKYLQTVWGIGYKLGER